MGYMITFYNVVDPPNKIKKNLGNVIGATGVCSPWEAVSDLSGSVLTNYNAAVESSNYCHIVEDGRERYCYIREFEKVPGGQMRVHMDVDPLVTYMGEILNLDCFCTRTNLQAAEGSNLGYNMDMFDNKRPTVVYDRIQVIGSEAGGLIKTFNATDTNIYAQCIGGDD